MNSLDKFAHPILSCRDAAKWEARLLRKESAEWIAMQKAGAAVGHSVLNDFAEIGVFPEEAGILVLVGKGHNGGDAMLAAASMLQRHPAARVTIVFCLGQAELRPLAVRAYEHLRTVGAARVTVEDAKVALVLTRHYAVCLDGVFGFQFRVPLKAPVSTILGRVNRHPGIQFRAAVDLPSGIGEKSDLRAAFRADFTYATGIVKQPLLTEEARACIGRLRYLDLGFFSRQRPRAQCLVLTTEVLAPLRKLRAAQTDKRTFGHVMLIGGSRSYPGAIMLAVRSALRSGAGLVTAFVPRSLAPEYASVHPEAMWVGCPESEKGALGPEAWPSIAERLERATALVMGPGMSAGPETLALMRTVVRETRLPLVLDADALRAEVVCELKSRAYVCTPHAGEFERIAPELMNAGRKRVTSRQGVIVLKGPLTRVLAGDREAISPFGGPVLARGGSGDVLAGLTGGLLAQTPKDPWLAACRGVVWHGHAADLLARARGQVAVEISEIFEKLGPGLQS